MGRRDDGEHQLNAIQLDPFEKIKRMPDENDDLALQRC